MGLALIFAVILGFVHFFSDRLRIADRLLHARAISFVAGISVTYTFLALLPEAYKSFERIEQAVFIFIIIGFTLVHVIEKYLYKEKHRKEELLHSLKEVHSIAFFGYYFLLGVILVELTNLGYFRSILFFVPILFYAAVGLTSLEKIHRRIIERPFLKFALSASTLAGVLFAPAIINVRIAFDVLFALVIGAFIYIALIDFIPREKIGDPIYFTAGVVAYTLLIAFLLL